MHDAASRTAQRSDCLHCTSVAVRVCVTGCPPAWTRGWRRPETQPRRPAASASSRLAFSFAKSAVRDGANTCVMADGPSHRLRQSSPRSTSRRWSTTRTASLRMSASRTSTGKRGAARIANCNHLDPCRHGSHCLSTAFTSPHSTTAPLTARQPPARPRLPAVAQQAAGEMHRGRHPLVVPAAHLLAVWGQPRAGRQGFSPAARWQLRGMDEAPVLRHVLGFECTCSLIRLSTPMIARRAHRSFAELVAEPFAYPLLSRGARRSAAFAARHSESLAAHSAPDIVCRCVRKTPWKPVRTCRRSCGRLSCARTATRTARRSRR
mmetsp:Transcript_35854/g.94230  ORF Transcript_35854/g.94230 Transcript_35854/m.94230 type:complete len:321 (-) Transcript_35854:344-1306(-)